MKLQISLDIKIDALDEKVSSLDEKFGKMFDILDRKINFNTKLTLGFLSTMLAIIIAIHFIK